MNMCVTIGGRIAVYFDILTQANNCKTMFIHCFRSYILQYKCFISNYKTKPKHTHTKNKKQKTKKKSKKQKAKKTKTKTKTKKQKNKKQTTKNMGSTGNRNEKKIEIRKLVLVNMYAELYLFKTISYN